MIGGYDGLAGSICGIVEGVWVSIVDWIIVCIGFFLFTFEAIGLLMDEVEDTIRQFRLLFGREDGRVGE